MHRATASSNAAECAPRFMNSVNVAPAQTMSSREIAELTGSTHDNVLKTVRGLVAKGVVSGNETPYRHPQNGQTYHEYLLTQRDTLVVVSGYSVELRARIIDRWQELEGRQAAQPIVPQSYAEALRLAADQAEQNLQLQQVIERQAPKVAAIQRLAAAGGAICITDAAKQLQVPPSKMFAWLAEHRWIYRRDGSTRWVAYQPRLTSGYLIQKVTELKPHPETGVERAVFQPLVTPKGLARLAELIKKEPA